ncbi:MAG: hypothetical protein MUF18_20720, partial [Fimbriiglobus sp.]|nr:hypothetical protein [Fimbriiglobus sp.]
TCHTHTPPCLGHTVRRVKLNVNARWHSTSVAWPAGFGPTLYWRCERLPEGQATGEPGTSQTSARSPGKPHCRVLM